MPTSRREADHRYATSEKGRESKRRHERTPRGKARRVRYSSSPKGKATQRRYDESPKGRARSGRYEDSHLTVQLAPGVTRRYAVPPGSKVELAAKLAAFRGNQREERRHGRID